MLEILLIIFLSNKNKANAISRGRKPGMFIGLTIGLWFGLELLGALIGSAAGLGAGTYGLALLFAAIGGVTSYLIAKNCKTGDYVPPEQTMSKAIADSAQPLSIPAQITLVRESSMVGAIVRWDFLLNGTPVGSLSNGSSMTITTSQRQNILRAKDAYGSEIPPYVFDLADGARAEIHFKTNRFLPEQSKGILPSSISAPQQAPEPAREQASFCLRCGTPLVDGAAFCSHCGEPRFAPAARQADAASVWDWPQAEAQTAQAEALPANPKRAVWAAGLLFVSWILLYLFQGLFRGRLLYNSEAGFLIADAALGAAVYLLLQRRIELKCAGGVTGLLCVLMLAGSSHAFQAQSQFLGNFSLPQVWALSSPVFWRMFTPHLLGVILTLAAAVGADYLLQKRPEGNRLIAVGGIAAGVFFLASLLSTVIRIGPTLRYMAFPNVFSLLFSLIADPLILFLAVLFLDRLCTMKRERVQLRGLGLAWGWIAVFGMFFGLIALIAAGTRDMHSINYTSGLLLALAGMAGYILMLCKKRVGFYVLLAGAVLMLGSQFLTSLTALFYGGSHFLPQFLGAIFGGVNPLLAWLAVRAADRQPASMSETRPQPFEPVQQNVHGFHKFAAVFIIVTGGILFLLPFPFLIHGDSFVAGMGACMAAGLILAAFGAWCVAAQRSTKKLYPMWMKALAIIVFVICAFFALAIFAGLVQSI